MLIGGEYGIVPDPTNSMDKKGKPRSDVLKIWVSGPSQQTDWGGSRFWRNISPTWIKGENRTVRAPSAIKVDIFVPSSIHAYLGVLSVHRYNTVTGDKDSVAGYEIDEMGVPVLYVNDGKGKAERAKLKSGLFHNGEWNTLELALDDGMDGLWMLNDNFEILEYE